MLRTAFSNASTVWFDSVPWFEACPLRTYRFNSTTSRCAPPSLPMAPFDLALVHVRAILDAPYLWCISWSELRNPTSSSSWKSEPCALIKLPRNCWSFPNSWRNEAKLLSLHWEWSMSCAYQHKSGSMRSQFLVGPAALGDIEAALSHLEGDKTTSHGCKLDEE